MSAPPPPPVLAPPCTLWGQIYTPDGFGGFTANGWEGTTGDTPGNFVTGGIGGANYSGAAIPGPDGNHPVPLFLTCQMSGSTTMNWNLGQQPFIGKVPAGFWPGWPGADGLPIDFGVTAGWDYFDASTVQGDLILDPSGTLISTTADAPGLVQSHTGYAEGCFYVEVEFVFNTFFTTGAGGGIGRFGPALDNWFGGGGFAPGDTNGGGMYSGGNLGNGFHGTLNANGAVVKDGLPANTTGSILALAISISPSPFPFVHQPLTAVDMVCVPCAPLVTDPAKWPNHFG